MPHPAPGHHSWTESSGPTVFLAAINYFLPLEQPWCSSGEPALSFSQTTWLRQGCCSPGLRKWVTCLGPAQWVSALRLLLEILGKTIFFFLGGKAEECKPRGCPAGSLPEGGGARRVVGLREGYGFAQLKARCA